MLEYQRACPQENHPDMAGLHLSLPLLVLSFLLSSNFSLLSPHLPSFVSGLLLSSSYLISLRLSLLFSSSVSKFCSKTVSPPSPSPLLSLSFFFLPPQPKWPPVLWDLISVKSKVQSLLGPEIQKQRQRDREREREIESVAPQTHKTTVASPQAQRLGPGRLAGPLSTSLGAKLNTNRRGLAVETKPWCHAAYFPWKALGVLGPTPGDMRSP